MNGPLENAPVATYAATIREGGEANGKPLGVLGIFFDWKSQAQTVVNGVRLRPEEKSFTRCLLVDQNHRVIAASDDSGILSERISPDTKGGEMGSYVDPSGHIVGYALPPGYETYAGLGWYGIIVQNLPPQSLI